MDLFFGNEDNNLITNKGVKSEIKLTKPKEQVSKQKQHEKEKEEEKKDNEFLKEIYNLQDEIKKDEKIYKKLDIIVKNAQERKTIKDNKVFLTSEEKQKKIQRDELEKKINKNKRKLNALLYPNAGGKKTKKSKKLNRKRKTKKIRKTKKNK